jgi:translation initiation factor 3 subunit E
MSALWGKLGSDILMQNFEAARDDIFKLKETIDNQTFAAPLVQLQQRTWLMHWSLFVFWNHEKGRDDLIDLFMSPAYLAAIQINAQHLLRYLAAAVVVHKKRRNVQKDLIR